MAILSRAFAVKLSRCCGFSISADESPVSWLVKYVSMIVAGKIINSAAASVEIAFRTRQMASRVERVTASAASDSVSPELAVLCVGGATQTYPLHPRISVTPHGS
eukprot:COSAG05_NODE_54_length_23549_cov_81.790840_9_plen_105_part_00